MLTDVTMRVSGKRCEVRSGWGFNPGCDSVWGRMVAMVVAVGLNLVREPAVRAEDHVDYKYENYAEERDRMTVNTHSALFDKGLTSWLSVRGELVYDGISGASPTGAPPPPGSSEVPTRELSDIRRAATVEPAFRWGRTTTRPQFAYSLENDYESYGVALNETVDLNEKNTTLAFGVSHDFDTVMPKFWGHRKESKDTTDFLVGVTQVLTRSTLLTVNLTLENATGYLADPYKGVRFDGYPDPNALFPEKRPDRRSRQVGYVSLTQYVTPLRGSFEVAYRFAHDSFEVYSHTASAAWFFNLGKYVVLSPMFRYYQQTDAYFYGVRFPGNPVRPRGVPIPEYYSADYRLSALESFTYGAAITVKARKWLYVDAAYKRYEMAGLNPATPASNFPAANVYTVGVRLWF